MKTTMMMVGAVALVASVFAAAGAARPVPAYAYSASDNGSPSIQFQGLFSPFENFINSVHLVGAPVIRVGAMPPGVLPPAVQTVTQNAIHAALGIFSWILGMVKDAVDRLR